MENGPARYWAFISYSHQDEAWGRWLHRALEIYRVPKRLVGTQTRAGSIPRRLLPIFRDRDELPSSAELAATINRALEESRFQIVICSPHAASSRWVNEEIKAFKRLGRDSRILAFIVDGSPNASEVTGSGLAECFPRALRHRLDKNGEVGDVKAEVVAADARKGKDGRENAKLKLIAGMLGVGFDELKQRERARQRLRRIGVVALSAVLALGVIGMLRTQQQIHAAQEHQAYLRRLVDIGAATLEVGEYARAATYLSAALSLGERSADARLLLARALPSVEAMTFRAFRISKGFFPNWIQYTPDGEKLLVMEQDIAQKKMNTRLLDLGGGPEGTLKDSPSAQAVIFSRDARRVLFTAQASWNSRELTSQVYDLNSGNRLLSLPGAADVWNDGMPALYGTASDQALRQLVTLGSDHRAIAWNSDGGQRRVLRSSTAIVSAAFSPDGSEVVTGGEDGEIVVWNAITASIQRSFHVKPPKPTAAFFIGGDIVTLGENGAINLWDAKSGEFQGVLSGHGSKVILAQPDANGRRLLTAAENEPARVWDLVSQRSIFVTPERQEAYRGFDFSSDGQWIMTGSADLHAVLLFLVSSGSHVGTLDGHNGPVFASALSRDGTHSFTAGYDGLIREWDNRGLRPVPLKLLEHDGAMGAGKRPGVNWAGFDEQGRIVSVGGDSDVHIWSDNSDRPPQLLHGHTDAIVAAALGLGGTRLITGSADHSARVWDLSSGQVVAVLAGAHQQQVDRVAISANGKLAATLDFVEPVGHVWNAETGAHVFTLKGHTAPLRSVRFSADAQRVITASADKTAKVWDVRSGQMQFSLDGHTDALWAAVPSPDDHSIVTVSADHSARLWDARDGKLLRTLTADDAGALESATFTRDSQKVAIGADNGMVLLWDLRTGEARKFTGLDAGFSDAVAFSPDENLVASPSLASGEFGVWSVETGRLLMKWKDPKHYFFTVAFSPDGKRLAAAGPTKGEVADFPVFDVSLETRTPEQIAAVIRCKSPWQVDGERLLPHPPESPNCPGLIER